MTGQTQSTGKHVCICIDNFSYKYIYIFFLFRTLLLAKECSSQNNFSYRALSLHLLATGWAKLNTYKCVYIFSFNVCAVWFIIFRQWCCSWCYFICVQKDQCMVCIATKTFTVYMCITCIMYICNEYQARYIFLFRSVSLFQVFFIVLCLFSVFFFSPIPDSVWYLAL